jgi:transcriptional antiterminator NusG
MVNDTPTLGPDASEQPLPPATPPEGHAAPAPAEHEEAEPVAAAGPAEGPADPPEVDAAGDGEDGGAPPTALDQEEPAEPAKPDNKKWYVVKVQSGREESIKEAIERRVKIEGLEEFFDQILIPMERETIMRHGKRQVREKKLFPGYLMAKVEYNDRILYLFRETSGVGDFVGASPNHPPQPMKDHEVEKMLHKVGRPGEVEAKVKPRFVPGDRVKVKDGVFAGMEGEVKDLLEAKGLVRVELTVLGRPVPVELEYWQVEEV